MVYFIMTLFMLLFVKHLIVDFFMQGPYQYLNKGTYLHPGGLLHSGLHGVTTILAIILACAFIDTPSPADMLAAVILGIVDFVVHYHIDWAKMNINKKMGWGPTTHEQFWYLLGVDQFLHLLTYWLIVAAFVY